jgi:hypothetical protein
MEGVEENVAWPTEVSYCEDLVYRLQVTNYRDCTIKCSLNFTPISEQEELNLSYPRGGFKAMIQPKVTKTIMLLHKLKPSDSDMFGSEINKINTQFLFKEIIRNNRVKAEKGGKHVQIHPEVRKDAVVSD